MMMVDFGFATSTRCALVSPVQMTLSCLGKNGSRLVEKSAGALHCIAISIVIIIRVDGGGGDGDNGADDNDRSRPIFPPQFGE